MALLVYITAPSPEEARRIGSALVERRLAACVNIIPGMQALFHWDGAVQTADETILLAKTTQAHYPALEAAIKAMHPYDVPCIVALPVVAGSAAFLQWIDDETRQGA